MARLVLPGRNIMECDAASQATASLTYFPQCGYDQSSTPLERPRLPHRPGRGGATLLEPAATVLAKERCMAAKIRVGDEITMSGTGSIVHDEEHSRRRVTVGLQGSISRSRWGTSTSISLPSASRSKPAGASSPSSTRRTRQAQASNWQPLTRSLHRFGVGSCPRLFLTPFRQTRSGPGIPNRRARFEHPAKSPTS